MSKSKRRLLNRKITNPLSCTRADAVGYVFSAIKSHNFDSNAKKLLTLFGISGEELAEAGLSWEELKAVSPFFIQKIGIACVSVM